MMPMIAAAAIMGMSLNGANVSAAQGPPAQFIVHSAPKTVPEIAFSDDRERTVSLMDFRGKVVSLNLWATWCGPCRKEMPTLDRLQARLESKEFQVVALSIDRGGTSAVQKFYAENGIRSLAFFIDATGRAASHLALVGLPGTLLIDPEGREIARLIGPAEWDDPAMMGFLESRIAQTHRENASPPKQDTNER
jgi:thiol-disulfide isomerase/thioredoxin